MMASAFEGISGPSSWVRERLESEVRTRDGLFLRTGTLDKR